MSQMGHQRRFKRKSRTSACAPISGHIAASHRSATNRLTRDEARRIAAEAATALVKRSAFDSYQCPVARHSRK
jgi:hypothetical protein